MAFATSFSKNVLPVLGCATNQTTLSLADWREHINGTRAVVTASGRSCEIVFFLREQWRQIVKRHTVTDVFWVEAVDFGDPQQCEIFLALFLVGG